MSQKINICVLHGAISNAGDFLIYERGKKLLENFFGDNFEFTYKLRSERVDGDYDGLVILGGPIISRKMHLQSKNISKFVEHIGDDIPIFCLGCGISGRICDSDMTHFLDHESISFWKSVYETSKLFSVRDEITYDVLKKYGIKAELTGCPALFNLEPLNENKALMKDGIINKIAVTIPPLSIGLSLSRRPFSPVKSFLLSLYFLFVLKSKFHKREIGLIFQHGYPNLATKIMRKLAYLIGMVTYDVSGESLESFSELYGYDVHIGTRLHTHIYFLSSNKPSFLLSVDLRTEAFLKTIKTPSDRYTISGIGHLVDMLKEIIVKGDFDEFNNVPGEIGVHHARMEQFLNEINLFYNKDYYENNKTRH